jgi:hypothetical protein
MSGFDVYDYFLKKYKMAGFMGKFLTENLQDYNRVLKKVDNILMKSS